MLRKLISRFMLGWAVVQVGMVAHAQIGAGATPIPSIDTLRGYHQCFEYLPPHYPDACRIDFDMTQTVDGKLPPQTHKDITVHLGTDERGIVTLWRSSPFAACTLTTTPGPLARDLSPNLPGLFSTLGGFGASPGAQPPIVTVPSLANLQGISAAAIVVPGVPPTPAEIDAMRDSLARQPATAFMFNPNNAKTNAQRKQLSDQEKAYLDEQVKAYVDQATRSSQDDQKKDIRDQEAAITSAFAAFNAALRGYNELYGNVAPDRADLRTILGTARYSYRNNGEAREAIEQVRQAARNAVSRQLPDPNKSLPDLKSRLDDLDDKLAALKKKYGGLSQVQDFIAEGRARLTDASTVYNQLAEAEVVALLVYITDSVAKAQKVLDFINDWKSRDDLETLRRGTVADASVQILPIALYPESKVGVTVKCLDAVTSNPLFDSIQFNAYFQNPPQFDLSAGVLISLAPNRQYSVVMPYSAPPPTTPTNPASCAKNSPEACATIAEEDGSVQFIPGLFLEWHPFNFKLPGAKDPAGVAAIAPDEIPTWMSVHSPRHPLGYVGSFGPVIGLLANPNSGSTEAEFFAGVSFGVQRFVLLVGDHIARPLELTDGYQKNQLVPTGTTLPTANGWGNGVAFGITYRIPLR